MTDDIADTKISPTNKKKRLICLDIVRIIACLCIFTAHFNASVCGYDIYGYFAYSNEIIPSYYLGAYLGDIGTGLFFIISGASLQYTYGCIGNKKQVITFYTKRIKGIYPAFWIAFFVATLFSFYYYKWITDADIVDLF